MLELLHIENIAIIERADILFGGGFNALTGETGAGKSIVIDAIGDTDTMFNALMMRNGVVDVLKQWSIQVSVTEVDELLVPAYDGTIEYRYAQTATEDNVTDEETEAS